MREQSRHPPTAVILATLVVATAAGALCFWWIVTSGVWLDGGVPVQVSIVGHVIFLSLGALFGLIGGGILMYGGRTSNHPRRDAIILLSAAPCGALAGLTGLYVLVFTFFFTIPREWWELLTE